MTSSSAVIEAVQQQLHRLSANTHDWLDDYGPDAEILFAAAESAMHGGKRMRARFCHSGWSAVMRRSAPHSPEPEALWRLCASLEVFQAAALVHDDLIDNSDTRRGRPSSHRALEGRHRALGWAGDAAPFGRSAAILLGDLLLAWSDDLLEDALHGEETAASVRGLYARMRRDVTVGQFLDITEESAWSLTPDADHAERALRIVSLKSARYSVEQPLLLGAALAGADAVQRAALSAFGRPLGTAFQLRDDVLGVFGDPEVTGKPAGDDLREGKRTLLVALTRTASPPGVRRAIDELLGDPDLDGEQVRFLQATMRESGALDRVEELISSAAQEAERALSGTPLDHASVSELRELARAATVRTS